MENWKEINGFKNYQCSNLGNFRSISKGEALGLHINKGGYYLVCLYVEGKKQTLLAHRVIAKNWIPNPENKPQVNHKKGNKLDNRVVVLEWSTGKENIEHSIDVLGNKNKGGDKPRLNMGVARQIRLEFETKNISQLSRRYGVTRSSILKIIKYKSYRVLWSATMDGFTYEFSTQSKLSEFLNVSQPIVSQNIGGKVKGYNLERVDLESIQNI